MDANGRLSGRQPQAVRRALLVLTAVARSGAGTTVKQICHDCDLAPATAYRIVGLLVAEEYLVRLPDLQGLALGSRMSELVPDPAALPSPPTPDPDMSSPLRATPHQGDR